MNILHILNGDFTLHGFKDTGLDGDTLVWREIFSQGPLEADISSGHFWKARAEQIGEAFNDPVGDYQESMMDQLSRLSDPYDEIDLWFEFDLHCQANLLGVLNYLLKKTDLSAPSVFLICPNHFPGKENFMGMGELNGEELEYLYDTIRVQLSKMDFALAVGAWLVYVSRDAQKLKDFLKETEFWGNLAALKPALKADLLRLEVDNNGLNHIEKKLLDTYNSGIKTRPELYEAFWKTEKIYGMGDSEIDIYLNRLKEKGLIKL